MHIVAYRRRLPLIHEVGYLSNDNRKISLSKCPYNRKAKALQPIMKKKKHK